MVLLGPGGPRCEPVSVRRGTCRGPAPGRLEALACRVRLGRGGAHGVAGSSQVVGVAFLRCLAAFVSSSSRRAVSRFVDCPGRAWPSPPERRPVTDFSRHCTRSASAVSVPGRRGPRTRSVRVSGRRRGGRIPPGALPPAIGRVASHRAAPGGRGDPEVTPGCSAAGCVPPSPGTRNHPTGWPGWTGSRRRVDGAPRHVTSTPPRPRIDPTGALRETERSFIRLVVDRSSIAVGLSRNGSGVTRRRRHRCLRMFGSRERHPAGPRLAAGRR